MCQLSKNYGLSDVGLAKVCKKHRIPRPPRGYWAKLEHGREVHRPPLPRSGDDELETICISSGDDTVRGRVKYGSSSSNEQTLKMEVPDQLRRAHPLVRHTKNALAGMTPGYHGLVHPNYTVDGCLDFGASKENVARALRIMDSLIKALEDMGHTVFIKGERGKDNTYVKVGEEEIRIRITEPLERHKRTDEWGGTQLWVTGRLKLRIGDEFARGYRKAWADGKRQRLEDCLGSVVTGLVRAAEVEKAERLGRERRHQEWEEERRQKEERAEQRRQEAARVDELIKQAEAWHGSQKIRSFVSAVREMLLEKHGQIAPGSEADEWFEWATKQADRLDPLVDG